MSREKCMYCSHGMCYRPDSLNDGQPRVSVKLTISSICEVDWRYGDGAGNTVEENSSVFSLIRMH